MNKNLTDSEIVKALECCIDTIGVNCGECPYCDNCVTDENTSLMMTDALDLINRLQAKNEELVGNIDKLKAELFDKTEQLNVELQAMRGVANSYKAENERFKNIKNAYDFAEYRKQEIKAEAYKEFAERLKRKACMHNHKECSFPDIKVVCLWDIDRLLEELVGDGGCDTCKSLTCDGCELYEELVGEDNAEEKE